MRLKDYINKAIEYSACDSEIENINKYTSVKEALKDFRASYWCCWYAIHVLKDRFKIGEKAIVTDIFFWDTYQKFLKTLEK